MQETPRQPSGFYPWWFWNDHLSRDEVRWQVAQMAAQGVQGFYIAPRQGLGQPYLSDAFFEMVETAIDAAREHGLVVHFCDEYPYPTGAAGGEAVLGNPEFHATRLHQETSDIPGGAVRRALPRGRVLCCQAYRLTDSGEVDWRSERDLIDAVGVVLTDESYVETGPTAYNRKRYFASNPTPILDTELPPGPWRVFISVQCVIDRHKYWGHFLDVLNPEAAQHFIDVTYGRYAERLGDNLGSRLYSLFVDETTPHWSARIPAAIAERYGYDLLRLLPALQDRGHPEHLRVSRDLWTLRYELFCDTFERPIRDWCAAHGIRYGGEKPSLRLAQLQYMDIPGCEPGHTKAGDPMDMLRAHIRDNARATASAAYFYGKEGSVCECYHSIGWSGTLQDAKLIAEGLLLMGIRYLAPHAFFYSTHALKKHDAPPSFFFQMPHWSLFYRLSERVRRIGEQFDETYIDAQTLVVDPSPGLPTADDLQAYEDLQEILMAEHIDFLTVDTDLLEAAELANGYAQVRDVQGKLVIVPPMQDTEAPLGAWLDRFAEAGGHVIRCGQELGTRDLRQRVLDVVRPSLQLETEDGNAGNVQLVTRRSGDRQLWFLLNTSADPVGLRLGAECSLCEIPLEDGMPPLLERNETGFVRELAPFESVLLAAGEEDAAGPAPPARIRVDVGRDCRVMPRNNNLLRLAEWDLCLVDEEGNEGPSARVPAVPIANQLRDSKLPFAPQVEGGFGTMPSLRFPELHARYRAAFTCEYAGNVSFVMEPGSIRGHWTVSVNGNEITPEGLAPVEAHVRGSLGQDITAFLVTGSNEIVVDVRTDRLDGGLLNPLYLAGDFAVAGEPTRIIEPRDEGQFEDYEANGLPYYGGVIDYEQTVEISDVPPGDVVVDLNFPCRFEEACEVSLNDGPLHPMPWSPRRIVASAGELRAGANRLRIRVYTSLIRPFEGTGSA